MCQKIYKRSREHGPKDLEKIQGTCAKRFRKDRGNKCQKIYKRSREHGPKDLETIQGTWAKRF
jgi:hypothetical protein